MRKIGGICKLTLALIFYCFLFIPGKIIYSRKKIWLFCERGYDAKDNSYFFFKWINENHPEINSVYLISKDSENLDKVRKCGNICYYKSIKHWLIFIGSKVRLTTHLFSYVPEKYLSAFFMKYFKKNGVDVFLQHGITYNYQDCFLSKNNKSNIIICGAKKEYEYLSKNFDISQKLRLTGFPRYDSLNNEEVKNKIILIQPTWRRVYASLSSEKFKKTDYCLKWNSILSSKKIYDLLCRYDTYVRFNVHPSFAKYKDCFVSKYKDRISVEYDCNDIQKQLKTSSLLITDYSSIFFDYAFLKKPIIYYQFDSDSFFSNQYNKGDFRIEKDGFGPVVFNEEALILKLESLLENDLLLPPEVKEKIDNFFGQISSCCSKVYESIIYYEK